MHLSVMFYNFVRHMQVIVKRTESPSPSSNGWRLSFTHFTHSGAAGSILIRGHVVWSSSGKPAHFPVKDVFTTALWFSGSRPNNTAFNFSSGSVPATKKKPRWANRKGYGVATDWLDSAGDHRQQGPTWGNERRRIDHVFWTMTDR